MRSILTILFLAVAVQAPCQDGPPGQIVFSNVAIPVMEPSSFSDPLVSWDIARAPNDSIPDDDIETGLATPMVRKVAAEGFSLDFGPGGYFTYYQGDGFLRQTFDVTFTPDEGTSFPEDSNLILLLRRVCFGLSSGETYVGAIFGAPLDLDGSFGLFAGSTGLIETSGAAVGINGQTVTIYSSDQTDPQVWTPTWEDTVEIVLEWNTNGSYIAQGVEVETLPLDLYGATDARLLADRPFWVSSAVRVESAFSLVFEAVFPEE